MKKIIFIKIPYTDISHREISFELSQLIKSIYEIPKKCLVQFRQYLGAVF